MSVHQNGISILLAIWRDWILILDADESVSPELREEILNVVMRPVSQVRHVGFYINRVLIFMGRKIWHCGYFPYRVRWQTWRNARR